MSTLSLDYFDKSHPLYKKLEAFGIPDSKTEQYKNFPIKSILEKEYSFKSIEFSPMKEGDNLVIKNGFVLEYPRGVKILFDKTFGVDEKHFDVLYFASHLLAPVVLYLEVKENMKFEIQHFFDDMETLLSYRIVVRIRPNIQVEIFENFEMQGSEESLLLYGLDVSIEDDSTLVWVRNENRQDNEANLIGTNRFIIFKQASLELKTFDYGSANSLHLYKIDLQEYAWVDAMHLLLASKKARRGNVVQINHNKPYAKSVQEARSILKESATGIFDAKICVTNKAPYSNTSQNSKAILLDEHAHMYAKPQLEIYIDELEASHGSSIGTLDEEALFYLCSRGIGIDEARNILVLSFANRLINTVKDEQYAQKIHETFEVLLAKDLL